MPKDNPITREIPNLYKKQALHLVIYGFMTGVQWSLPSLTKKEAAEMFLKRFKYEDLNVSDIITSYDRTHKEALNAEKSNG